MEKIYKYIEDHAYVPSEALEWVVKQTHIRTNHARMLSGAAQGQLLRMFVQMTGASRVLELGTFTGYSAICLASITLFFSSLHLVSIILAETFGNSSEAAKVLTPIDVLSSSQVPTKVIS